MGRGRPLPPPGTPLPMPDRKTKTAPIPVPRRKPATPPPLPNRGSTETEEHHKPERRPVPPPPLPKRRQFQSNPLESDGDNMLIVPAPADSEPGTPTSASQSPAYVQPWVEEVGDDGKGVLTSTNNDITLHPATPEQPSEARVMASPGSSNVQNKGKQTELPLDHDQLKAGEDDADDDEYEAWMGNTGLDENREQGGIAAMQDADKH